MRQYQTMPAVHCPKHGAGMAGTLAVFGNGGNTLAESLLNQSGTTLATTAQALQGNDSQGLSILTANASGASGGLTLQSGDSSTTGSGDVNIDTDTEQYGSHDAKR